MSESHSQEENQLKTSNKKSKKKSGFRIGNCIIWGKQEETGKRICLDYRPIEWLELIGAYIALYVFFAGFFALLLWIFMRIHGYS
jgi:hypothetical protein